MSHPCLAGVAAALILTSTGALAAQEPPDSLPPDSLAVPDSLVLDSLALDSLALDSLAQAADTLDTLSYSNLPAFPEPSGRGWADGTWTFDAERLEGSRDLTLLELLEDVPGILPLRGGDFGAPEALTAFGLSGGRVRVFWDGMELPPLDGGVNDLGFFGLGGLASIRVERGPGEIRIHLTSLTSEDPRPMSLVEAGTGDLDTSLFRGTFIGPRALGGSLGLSLDRMDTRGARGDETGSRTALWLRYAYTFSDDAGVELGVRRSGHEIDSDYLPGGSSRNDWVLRARRRFGERFTAEAFVGGSSFSRDGTEALLGIERDRSQRGARLAWSRENAHGTAVWRDFEGDGPSRTLEVEGGLDLFDRVSASARWSSEDWEGRGASLVTVRVASRPLYGLSLYGSWSSGERGSRAFPARRPRPAPTDTVPVAPEEMLPSRFADVEAWRAGASFTWRGLTLEGARLRTRADSLLPLGLTMDRGSEPVPGTDLEGWEARVELPIPLDGFSLMGFYQKWEDEAAYVPEELYQGALQFHDVFFESGDLEVWGALGVRGREAMLVPQPTSEDEPEQGGLARVPFYQNWYIEIQARIVSLRIFIRSENISNRRNLMDFPDRLLPATRSFYGIRWRLWN